MVQGWETDNRGHSTTVDTNAATVTRITTDKKPGPVKDNCTSPNRAPSSTRSGPPPLAAPSHADSQFRDRTRPIDLYEALGFVRARFHMDVAHVTFQELLARAALTDGADGC